MVARALYTIDAKRNEEDLFSEFWINYAFVKTIQLKISYTKLICYKRYSCTKIYNSMRYDDM